MQGYQPRSKNRDFLRSSQLFQSSSSSIRERMGNSNSTNAKKFLKVYSSKKKNNLHKKNELKESSFTLPVIFNSSDKQAVLLNQNEVLINPEADPCWVNSPFSHTRNNSFVLRKNLEKSFTSSEMVQENGYHFNPEIKQIKESHKSFPNTSEILKMHRFRHAPSQVSTLSYFSEFDDLAKNLQNGKDVDSGKESLTLIEDQMIKKRKSWFERKQKQVQENRWDEIGRAKERRQDFGTGKEKQGGGVIWDRG